ncbi:MAG: AAA family ATPase [Gammaproteobacteria bacterium]|nr:AAA family ATPase [Gammaproteobacteria bacterium]
MTAPESKPHAFPGARWWKFDLHAHTPASADYAKGPHRADRSKIEPEDWLLNFMRAEIDCVAVTDHNSGDWVDKLKSALDRFASGGHPDYRPLHLFPGVEVTANGGARALAIFDHDRGAADINTLLGAVGYRGVRGHSDRAADQSLTEVVQAIAECGAIAVLAHVDGPAGAWNRMTGSSLAALFDCDDLFAMEVAQASATPPEQYLQRRLAWAKVLGSASHDSASATNEPGSHFTWVKMGEPRLDGLRLALLDGGGFSIRRSDETEAPDPNVLPPHYIEAIEIDAARYMGRGRRERLDFSPWLNALVGGRGTGKSTVVHALRVAARRDAELTGLDDQSLARRTFERFQRVPSQRSDRGGLTRSTEYLWQVVRDDTRYRVRWRQAATGVAVEEAAADGWRPSSVQSVESHRIPLRIFSQGQIGELAGENQQALLNVIDDAAGTADAKRRLQDAVNEFRTLRARVRELNARLAARDGLVVEREDVARKLSRFEAGRHRAVLAAYQRRRHQRQELERQFEAAEQAAGRIDASAAELLAADVPDGTFDDSPEDAAATSTIGAIGAGVTAARGKLEAAARDLRQLVATERRALEASTWHAVARQAESDYAALVQDLQAEGISDPREYGRLTQDGQRLDGELANLESLAEQRKELATQAEQCLDRVLDCRRAISSARQDFLEGALARNRFVRVAVNRYGDDSKVIERSMREALNVLDDRFAADILLEHEDGARGSVAELLTQLPNGTAPRGDEMERRIALWKDRVRAASDGEASGFGGAFSNFLARETRRSPALLDGLLTWFPEDALQVEYSPAGDGTDFRSIGQASAGQRAAAMLAFLLAHGDEPLVLDQPEDDLDNHLIYDLVVRQMRENKRRRQIIVVTHNPNIVVNGDAEMLHALDFQSGQCIVTQSGSLQDPAMREEVCRIMEGGREAFERRYRRLGRE